jgi:NIMA (never in mitosis gene a)-related kinase
MSLSDFRVEKLLGKGSFGDVYKAIRKDDNETYALKRVDITQMDGKEISDAMNEIRFLASMRHDNILGFLHSFLTPDGNELCIVTEYCAGGDLEQFIEKCKKGRKPIKEQRIWEITYQLCEALKCLHSHSIVHRDIKAANCFLTKNNQLKLGDLNVSKLMKGNQLLKTQIGTPYYMAPEIWKNKPYGPKCDIFSLGCLVYELASFHPPFNGKNLEELARSVTSGYFAAIPKCYSKELQQMIDSLLQTHAHRRPTAVEILASRGMRKWTNEDDDVSVAPSDLISTIKVPGGPSAFGGKPGRVRRASMQRLSKRLPEPCYPDCRPNSPCSWPIAKKKHAQLMAQIRRREQALAASGSSYSSPQSVIGSEASSIRSGNEERGAMPIAARGMAGGIVASAREQLQGNVENVPNPNQNAYLHRQQQYRQPKIPEKQAIRRNPSPPTTQQSYQQQYSRPQRGYQHHSQHQQPQYQRPELPVVTRAPVCAYQPEPPRQPLAPIVPPSAANNGRPRERSNYYPSPLQKPRQQHQGHGGHAQPPGYGRQRAPSNAPNWWG